MRTFFDKEYLDNYLKTKAKSFAQSKKLGECTPRSFLMTPEETLNTFLNSPAVDAVIDSKLGDLLKRPEGAFCPVQSN